ncbi:MAG: exodeoxyribonuclease VII large subunit [Nanoarchaeota archaeon]
MNEQQLIRMSLIGAVVGIIALYFVSTFTVSAAINIGEVTGNMIGGAVTVSGEIKDLYEHEDGHVFFTLKDNTGEIKTILWDETVKQLELNGVIVSKLENGDNIQITGEITTYKGELEIIPLGSRIKILN